MKQLDWISGDFWPNVLEDSIKEIEMEQQKQQQQQTDSSKSIDLLNNSGNPTDEESIGLLSLLIGNHIMQWILNNKNEFFEF